MLFFSILLLLSLLSLTMTVDTRPPLQSSDHVELTLVRHGESAANADPHLRYHPDYSEDYVRLSPKGRDQATALSKDFPQNGVQYWSSPMLRALETTSLLMRNAKTHSFIVDKRLEELRWPLFKNENERQTHKAAMKNVGMLAYENPAVGYFESGQDVVDRLTDFLLEHRAILRSQPNIIICHEIVMRAFNYLVSGDPTNFETQKFDNCETLKWNGDLMDLIQK